MYLCLSSYLTIPIHALSFQVAARVKSDDEKDEWILVKVIHFDKETKEYVFVYPSVVHACFADMDVQFVETEYILNVVLIAKYCFN